MAETRGGVTEFFRGDLVAQRLFDAVSRAASKSGPFSLRIMKSQISLDRAHPFAAVWVPGRVLHGETPPLVLSVYLPRRDASPRWKQVVEPAPGRFTHHLELRDAADVDQQVENWLAEAWAAAA